MNGEGRRVRSDLGKGDGRGVRGRKAHGRSPLAPRQLSPASPVALRSVAPHLSLLALLFTILISACARPAPPALALRPEPPCDSCVTLPMSVPVERAIESRIADLKARGSDCTVYGEVLENSLKSGRITVRPYMWRVGPNLASAQAGPNGEMEFAREIDPLNVGVRTLDDVLWSVEHEAVHVAFRIPSGQAADEASVDRHVQECRTGWGSRASR